MPTKISRAAGAPALAPGLAAAFTSDAAARALPLPHPKRMALLGGSALVVETLGSSGRVTTALADPTRSLAAVINDLVAHDQALRTSVMETLGLPGTSNFGAVQGLLTYLRHVLWEGRLFESTPALEALLLATDIDVECPVSLLQLPFPTVYLSCAATRDCPLRVWNRATQWHVLEGVYLQETRQLAEPGRTLSVADAKYLNIRPGTPVRTLTLLVVGSPIGKSNGIGDDATEAIELYLDDESMTVATALDRMLACHRAVRASYLTAPTPEEEQSLREGLSHAVKLLLYLNSREMRQQVLTPERELSERLARVGPAKQAKLGRQLARVYDRIVIGPDQLPPDWTIAAGGGRQMPYHWRRGHFRQQAYGPGWQQHRPVFIPPTQVRADRLQEPQAAPPDYRVR